MIERYLLFPGMVTSKRDGDRHYISASQLSLLYRVNPRDCLVLPEPSVYDLMYREELHRRVACGDLIALYPQYTGNYALPESTVNTVINPTTKEAP